MRGMLSILTALCYLAATLPVLQATPARPRGIQKKLELIRPGNFVVVMFGEEGIVSGRFTGATEDRLELKLEDPAQGERMVFYLKNVRDVQRAFPRGNVLYLYPGDLGALPHGQNIRLTTLDGTDIQGKVIKATDDEIVMRVAKSDAAGSVTGQKTTVHTSAISLVQFRSDLAKSRSAAVSLATGVYCLIPIMCIPAGIIGNQIAKSTVTIHIIQTSLDK